MSNNELQIMKERAAKELAHLLQKCLEFQQNQEKFMVKHDEIKSSLTDLSLSNEEFIRLKSVPRETLNLQKFTSLRVYEMVNPLKMKVKELETIKSSLQSTVTACEKELEIRCRESEKKSEDINHLREKLFELSSQCNELRSELKLDDFKVHNFDRIKRGRDKYEEERETLLKEKSELELSYTVCNRERKVLEENLSELKMKFRLQEQELSKYRNEFLFAQTQLEKGKENTIQTSSRLRLEKERNDDIYEKYLTAQEKILSLSGNLQDATNEVKTWKEKFNQSSKIEMEIREQLNQLQILHTGMSNEMEYLQAKFIKNKDVLKLETDEFKLRYNSLSKSYNDILENNSKLLKENQSFHSLLQDEKLSKKDESMKLKQDLTNLRRELSQYKSLENDYMSTLKVFASVPDEREETENGARASSFVKGKHTENTISLTRRILNLEKQNVEACSTINKFIVTLDQLRSSLASYKATITMVNKPHSQLLEKIRAQEENILTMEKALFACGESKERLQEEVKTAKSYLDKTGIQKKEILDLKEEIAFLTNYIEQVLN